MAHTVLYLACPGYNVLLNIRRWIRSRPPDTTLPHLSVSSADGANNRVCSEELDCFSSVPTKKPRQLSWIPSKSNRTDHKLISNNKLWTPTNTDAKRLPVTQTLVFLVQTSSCNFILESLWIPGTSILRYGIYRLNYESKFYQYVEILYVQLNCSMLVHWVAYALLFAGWICRRVLIVAMRAPVSSPLHAEASWLNGETLVWEDLFYCVLYSYLDCRRLVKHENVPSNFQAPPSVCVYV